MKRGSLTAGTFPAVVGCALLLAACQDVPSPRGTDATDQVTRPDRVLARLDGLEIRESDVDARMASIPLLARPEYSGPVGKQRLLNAMIEEEILVRAALADGLDRDPGIAAQLEEHRRQVLSQASLDRRFESAREVTDEEARAFYEEHRDEYVIERTLKVRILNNPDEDVVRHARDMVLSEEATFGAVCSRFNTKDPLVKAAGLLPDRVRRGRAVNWLGNNPKFHEVVFALEPGVVSPVFETVHGFNIAMVEDVREEKQRPFEDVQRDIVARISRARTTDAVPELLAELKDRYHVELLAQPGPSADELYGNAEGAGGPRRKVELFQEFVEAYPKDPRVLEALFMIGFTRAEELGDREGARVAFQRVIEEFPDSELAQSARWMLSSEGSEVPELE